MSPRLTVFGAGGHGKVVVATAQAAGWSVDAVLDDDTASTPRELFGVPVAAPADDLRSGRPHAVLAIGDNRDRQRLAERYDWDWATLVHPRATVHPSVALGVGSVIFAGAIIQPGATIGRHVIVNSGAIVDHDAQIADFVHLAPGSVLAGGVRVGEGSLLGVGCRVLPGVRIGTWATIGAGAVVLEGVADGAVAVGVPARPRQDV